MPAKKHHVSLTCEQRKALFRSSNTVLYTGRLVLRQQRLSQSLDWSALALQEQTRRKLSSIY